MVAIAKAGALIKYDQMGPTPADEFWSFPMELLSFDEIACSTTPDFGKRWGFFDDRAQMDGYIVWLFAPRAEDHQPQAGLAFNDPHRRCPTGVGAQRRAGVRRARAFPRRGTRSPDDPLHKQIPYPYRLAKWDPAWIFVAFLVAGGFAFKPLWVLAGFIAALRVVVWCCWLVSTDLLRSSFPLIRALMGGRRRRRKWYTTFL